MARISNDIEIYERESRGWWEPGNYYFRSLQAVQSGRIGLIKSWLGPLSGKIIVDVGCGGGLLAVPLNREGATIIGIDISASSLKEAASRSGSECGYLVGDCNALPLANSVAEHVLLSDILDHTETWPQVIAEAYRVLRPQGLCYVSTLNRTWQSKFFGIKLSEGIGLIPRGTHEYKMFIRPEELTDAARRSGFELCKMQGQSIELWPTLKEYSIHLKPSSNFNLSYCALFKKL